MLFRHISVPSIDIFCHIYEQHLKVSDHWKLCVFAVGASSHDSQTLQQVISVINRLSGSIKSDIRSVILRNSLGSTRPRRANSFFLCIHEGYRSAGCQFCHQPKSPGSLHRHLCGCRCVTAHAMQASGKQQWMFVLDLPCGCWRKFYSQSAAVPDYADSVAKNHKVTTSCSETPRRALVVFLCWIRGPCEAPLHWTLWLIPKSTVNPSVHQCFISWTRVIYCTFMKQVLYDIYGPMFAMCISCFITLPCISCPLWIIKN